MSALMASFVVASGAFGIGIIVSGALGEVLSIVPVIAAHGPDQGDS
jgi:hypothetical protein